jgi:crotonobetainyl-CoA:carnitine CoA-transferase CaiB-like acyl-CoA transferase
MVRSYDHPTLGQIRYTPSPVKFSDWEMPSNPAPMLGQHTVEVLTQRLGLSPAEVNRLIDANVVKPWTAE